MIRAQLILDNGSENSEAPEMELQVLPRVGETLNLLRHDKGKTSETYEIVLIQHVASHTSRRSIPQITGHTVIIRARRLA